MGATELLARTFLEAHPEEAARLVEGMRAVPGAAVLAEAGPEPAARVVPRMAGAAASACVAAMEPGDAGPLLDRVAPGLAADLLRPLSEEARGRLLATLPALKAELLRGLLRHPHDRAGAWMDPTVLALPEDLSAGEALAAVERHPERARHYVYVVDRDERLVGVVSLRQLLLAHPGAGIRELMERKVASIPSRMGIDEVARSPHWARFHTLPVVDRRGRFAGVLSYQAFRRIQAELAPARAAGSAEGAALALAELYWLGLARMLGGGSGAGPTPSSGAAREA